MTGRAVVLLDVDPVTGAVTNARIIKSTRHTVLDRASIDALKKARFAVGTSSQVKIPINWSLGTGGYVEQVENMDDVLTRFLGKGTVVKGPIPEYPRYRAWKNKSGKGVYELHADAEGKVREVRIVKPSGDETFDRVAVKTLERWRLRRGPLLIELPLSFRLTPDSYNVDVAR